MRPLRTVFALLLAGALALAEDPIQIGLQLKIDSKVMGETRTVLVSTPRGYAGGKERYPVLYMTDGDAHLLHTWSTIDFLARQGLIPELIMVGITHPHRTRDLTPTQASRRAADGTERPVANSGGGVRFLEFVEKEVFPRIEADYRTQPFRVFAGHSLGGLLALHALAARPELFHGVIAACPSLNWDNDYPLRRLEEALKERRDLPRTLFVSMADEEDGDPRPRRFDRLRGILDRAKARKFVWEARHLADEDHGSAVLASHYWGLRRIFDGWRLGGIHNRFDGGLKELQAHYVKLGERMGFPVHPPERVVNLAGYQALARDRVDDALAIFRYNQERFPASPNVHDSLAEGLEKAGRRAEALELYRKAAELAEKAGDPQARLFAANRDRLAAALKPGS